MSALTQYWSTTINYLTCGVCGVPHGISQTIYDGAMNSGKSWHCPNGHALRFTDSEKTKLERELAYQKANYERKLAGEIKLKEWAREDAKQAAAARDRYSRKASAYKGILTKTKKRIGNGVCPCCNRTFQNLMNHMKTKHPKYKKVNSVSK